MNLSRVAANYLKFKRALGMRFNNEEKVLAAFCRLVKDPDIRNVRPQQVSAFLLRGGQVTTSWHYKFAVLSSFYRFVLGRGYAARSPLPITVPKRPEVAPPYIYTQDELRRLLEATPSLIGPQSPLRGHIFRTLLLTLYGAGLRIGEALRLTATDVDLSRRVISIRDTKFYKSRLVPIGPRLATVLGNYLQVRKRLPCAGMQAPLFPTFRGAPMSRSRAEHLFRRLRSHARIWREPPMPFQPRFHDIRHTSAVHRLVAWYRQGLDVQRLLPKLSVFLGHSHLHDTQRYLTMTPEILKQANRRFERYAVQEVRHG